MLLGRFDRKIRNNRIFIPKALRPFLASKELHLFSSEVGCLEVVPEDKLTEKEAKTAQLGVTKLEENGRLLIPQRASTGTQKF